MKLFKRRFCYFKIIPDYAEWRDQKLRTVSESNVRADRHHFDVHYKVLQRHTVDFLHPQRNFWYKHNFYSDMTSSEECVKADDVNTSISDLQSVCAKVFEDGFKK
ncbi:hypothetical protein HDV06_002405 [Boothiomyces sp. JEL0866]|nr:hypothetical protein HDV06_002405 [Boothiomyces sp. JEL0866]